MTKIELAKEITMFEVAFNKDFTSAQVDVWYEFFKGEELPLLSVMLTQRVKCNANDAVFLKI